MSQRYIGMERCHGRLEREQHDVFDALAKLQAIGNQVRGILVDTGVELRPAPVAHLANLVRLTPLRPILIADPAARRNLPRFETSDQEVRADRANHRRSVGYQPPRALHGPGNSYATVLHLLS